MCTLDSPEQVSTIVPIWLQLACAASSLAGAASPCKEPLPPVAERFFFLSGEGCQPIGRRAPFTRKQRKNRFKEETHKSISSRFKAPPLRTVTHNVRNLGCA